MKRIMMTLGCLCMLEMAAQQGRVGINTETPRATLDIEKSPVAEPSDAQGVIFPHISTEERNTFTEVAEGTMIYNTTKKCLEIYTTTGEDQGWKCMGEIPPTAPNIPKPQITLEAKGFYYNAYGSSLVKAERESTPRCGFVERYYFYDTYDAGVLRNDVNRLIYTITNTTGERLENIDLSNAVSIENRAGHSLKATGIDLSSVSLEVGESRELVYELSGVPQTGMLKTTLSYMGQTASQSIYVREYPVYKGDIQLFGGNAMDIDGVFENEVNHVKWIEYNRDGGLPPIIIEEKETMNMRRLIVKFNTDALKRYWETYPNFGLLGDNHNRKSITLLVDVVSEYDIRASQTSLYYPKNTDHIVVVGDSYIPSNGNVDYCHKSTVFTERRNNNIKTDYTGKGIIYPDGTVWDISKALKEAGIRDAGGLNRYYIIITNEEDGVSVDIAPALAVEAQPLP